MKVLLVIDTFHRGRHVLLELPFHALLSKNKNAKNSNSTPTTDSK